MKIHVPDGFRFYLDYLDNFQSELLLVADVSGVARRSDQRGQEEATKEGKKAQKREPNGCCRTVNQDVGSGVLYCCNVTELVREEKERDLVASFSPFFFLSRSSP